jgi:hypothetical protein
MLNGHTSKNTTVGLAKFKQKTNAFTSSMERSVAKNIHHKPSYNDVDDVDMTFEQKRHLFDENRHAHSPSRENSQERSSLSPLRKNYEVNLSPDGKPPAGPQKPARSFERRRAFSRYMNKC